MKERGDLTEEEVKELFSNPYVLSKTCDAKNIELIIKLYKRNLAIANELEILADALSLLGLPDAQNLHKMATAIEINSEKMREEYSRLQYEAANMELRGIKHLTNSILTMALDPNKDSKRLAEEAALLAESQGIDHEKLKELIKILVLKLKSLSPER